MISSPSNFHNKPFLKISIYIALFLMSFLAQANQRVYSLDKLKAIESLAQKTAATKFTLAEVLITKESFGSTGEVRQARVGATGDNVIDSVLNQIATYFVAPFLTSKGVSLLTKDGSVIDPGMKMTVDGLNAQFARAQAKDYTFIIEGKEYTIKYQREES